MKTFCRYNETSSILHKIDPRIKLLFLISFSVLIFLNYGNVYLNLTVSALLFLILIIFTILSKSSILSIFRSLKALWMMILLLFIINILFNEDQTSFILFSINIFNGINIRIGTLLNILYVLVRLIEMLIVANIFTTTTKPKDITYAIEFLLTPLKAIKIPVHKFSMALSLALRFVPTLSDEAKRVLKAQQSKGIDLKNGKFKEKIIAIKSLIVPLFIQVFIKSEKLSDAMSARGYDPNAKRTKYVSYSNSIKDIIAIIVLLILLATFITLSILKINFYQLLNIELPYL